MTKKLHDLVRNANKYSLDVAFKMGGITKEDVANNNSVTKIIFFS